jgi:glycosyltransferase involved in cell wall biosynthesis
MRDISTRKELSALRELVGLFKRERPDVVHLNSSKAGGLGALAARLARVPRIIFTSHGLAWDEDRNFLARMAIYISSWVTFVLCHQIILISQDTYERASRLPFCARKTRLIHNGIPPVAYVLKEEARAALRIPPAALVVGALGEFTWNKQYHVLIRAAGELKRAGKNIVLCLMGEGEERAFIETLIEEEDIKEHAILAGFVPDGSRYLRAYDIFVLPSVKEGLPYVLMEAGLAGLASVGSRIPGIVNIVADGISGLLVAPKNHHALAAALQKLIDDEALRRRLGDALKARVEQEFSIAKMVEETQTIYD